MLSVKANKKLVQHHVKESTGINLTLKDLHNIHQKLKPTADNNRLMSLLELMVQEHGSTAELICTEDDNTLRAIYYQDRRMKVMMSAYPELVLIDATYRLNDLRMPLYVLMVVDGNGESQVVGLWIVANEEKDTIERLMDIFIAHNTTTNIKVFMADKDMVERQVIAEKLPHVSLQICLFHTLRSFKREITAEKMQIKQDQRQVVLNILNKMAYSKNVEEYNKWYDSLRETNLPAVMRYFEANWHNIRREWVEGFKRQSCNLMNSTNNRVESLNQKLKSVITRYSGIVSFFRDLKITLAVLARERDNRAINVFMKVSTMPRSDDEQGYSDGVTPYALSHISTHLKASPGVIPPETTADDCPCGFHTSMMLPCKHIFAYRRQHSMDIVDLALVHRRWLKEYFLERHPALTSLQTPTNLEEEENDVNVHTTTTSTKRVLSQHEKYRKAHMLSTNLASLASEATGRRYKMRMKVLHELERQWKEDKEVVVVEVCRDPQPDINNDQHHEHSQYNSLTPEFQPHLPVSRVFFICMFIYVTL